MLFDIGHGMGSFAFKTARAMLANGFYPDTISSGVHALCINGPAFDQVTTLSKLYCMGMSLNEVIAASTVNAAMALKRPELGTLSEGAEADVVVLRWVDRPRAYADCGRARLDARGELECAMTLRAGRIVWDPGGLSMPAWREAPPAYWRVPALQE